MLIFAASSAVLWREQRDYFAWYFTLLAFCVLGQSSPSSPPLPPPFRPSTLVSRPQKSDSSVATALELRRLHRSSSEGAALLWEEGRGGRRNLESRRKKSQRGDYFEQEGYSVFVQRTDILTASQRTSPTPQR